MQVTVPEITIAGDVALDAKTTGLIIVDMQNDFVREDGKLSVPDAASTIPAIRALRELARHGSMPVFYTQDWHGPGDPEFEIWGEHCLAGTEGAEIVAELAPDAASGDQVFRKVRYDGFFGTGLDDALRAAGIETVVVCGTVANICVLHTAGSAALRWYRVVLPIDATSALDPFDLQSAMRQVEFLYRGTVTRVDALHVADR